MSMFGGNMAIPSLADIAAVTRNGNNDGDGFGNGNGWWVLIILFAIFGGWGNGGFGGGYGGGQAVYDTGAGMQRGFDTSQIIAKLDGITNGICNLGYDQLAQMNGINTNILQTGFGITNAIQADTVANMQNTNAISRQLADCCCDNRAAIKDLQYNLATQSCALGNNVHQTGDAIIQNQNQGFQMLNNTIRDGFTSLEFQNQQRYIAELERKLNACDRDSALQAMGNYVVNQVRPTPGPAWIVDNPWSGCCNNGYNNSCCRPNTCCA